MYILDTADCKIPRTDLIPEYYEECLTEEQIPDCSYEKLLGTVSTHDKVRLHETCYIDYDMILTQLLNSELKFSFSVLATDTGTDVTSGIPENKHMLHP